MTALLAEERPEAVFHLAAQIDVRRAVEDPAYDAAVNVGGTAVMLEAARAAGTRRFLLASTGGAIYGDCDRLPTPEDAPAAPISPYGASKAAAETYLALYRRLHGLSTCALRLANVYGPRQDPLGEGGVVAIYCHAAANSKAVRVFGDGRQTRDFVYVGDVAAAFVAASERDVPGPYNVGTGEETSVLELRGAARARGALRARTAGRGQALRPRPGRRARGAGLARRGVAGRGPRAHDAGIERRRAPCRAPSSVRATGPALAAPDALAVLGDLVPAVRDHRVPAGAAVHAVAVRRRGRGSSRCRVRPRRRHGRCRP